MSAGMIRVLVAKKKPAPDLSAAKAAGIRVVGNVRSEEQLLDNVRELQPDVILADRDLAQASSLGPWIQLIDPDGTSPTVLMFLHGPLTDDIRIAAVFGCCVPNEDAAQLFQLVRIWWRSVRFVFDSLTLGKLERPAAARLARLSRRESQVLELICQDIPTRQIAEQLSISPRTVDAHRSNLMKKLGIHSTVGLVRLALAEGWVDGRRSSK